jgi:hypothetical protein
MAMLASDSKLCWTTIQLPQPMDPQRPISQSADGQLVVIATAQGALWQVCSGGVCVQAHSGVRLIEAYRQLRISQGLPVPPG